MHIKHVRAHLAASQVARHAHTPPTLRLFWNPSTRFDACFCFSAIVVLHLFVCCKNTRRERESKSARVWVRASLDNDAAITGSFIQPPASSISLSGIPLPVCHPCSATPTSYIQSQGINESGVQLCRKSKRATGDAPEGAGRKTHWIEWRKSAYVRT